MVYLLPTRLGDMLWEHEKCHGNTIWSLRNSPVILDVRERVIVTGDWKRSKGQGGGIWVKSTQVGKACEGGKENVQQWGARRGDGSKRQNSSKWKEKSGQPKPHEEGVERT